MGRNGGSGVGREMGVGMVVQIFTDHVVRFSLHRSCHGGGY